MHKTLGTPSSVISSQSQRAGLQADASQRQAEVAEPCRQRLRFTRDLGLADDPAVLIDDAHGGLGQRDVEAGIVAYEPAAGWWVAG
ncbi:hypothetical protein Y590_22420 [Methylobacterium sp. AMS5]|nr:hypothetical protein Y590_22420 [Methylobacterium sp. AMS5]